MICVMVCCAASSLLNDEMERGLAPHKHDMYLWLEVPVLQLCCCYEGCGGTPSVRLPSCCSVWNLQVQGPQRPCTEAAVSHQFLAACSAGEGVITGRKVFL